MIVVPPPLYTETATLSLRVPSNVPLVPTLVPTLLTRIPSPLLYLRLAPVQTPPDTSPLRVLSGEHWFLYKSLLTRCITLALSPWQCSPHGRKLAPAIGPGLLGAHLILDPFTVPLTPIVVRPRTADAIREHTLRAAVVDIRLSAVESAPILTLRLKDTAVQARWRLRNSIPGYRVSLSLRPKWLCRFDVPYGCLPSSGEGNTYIELIWPPHLSRVLIIGSGNMTP